MRPAQACSLTSRARQEPLAGTAPVATGWLLIEEPGPWGRDGLLDADLGQGAGRRLAGVAAGCGVRVLLIRRPGARRRAARVPGRRIVHVHAGPTPWMTQRFLTDDRELADVDPAVALEPDPPGDGRLVGVPWYLVCTHGRRDRCCASFGRLVVDALAAHDPEGTWECSHLGGHRFAGNLLVLPAGLAYGGLDAPTALALRTGLQSGRLVTGRLRGRTGLSRPGQAAEVLVRTRLRLDEGGAVRVVGVREAGEATWVADLVVNGRARSATVRREATQDPRLLSCDAHEPEDPGRFLLVDLSPATPDPVRAG